MNKKVAIVGSTALTMVNCRGDFLKRLVEQGYAVHSRASDNSPELSAELQKIGVFHTSENFSRAGMNPVDDLKFRRQLKDWLCEIAPDFFIGYGIKPVSYGCPIAAELGIHKNIALITGLGYAFTNVNSIKKLLTHRIARFMYKRALRFTDAAIFQNADDLALFNTLRIVPPGKGFHVNGSGVNTDFFEQTPLPETTSFLMIARLLYDKGVMEYLKAAEIIKENYPEVSFELVGGLDENPSSIKRKELNHFIEKGIVTWHGYHSDVRKYYRNNSVYVLPSYREGTPRTVLEAMSTGRPIITTDTPGCRQTVRSNGFLVPVKNVPVLADKMRFFLENADEIQRMGNASRDFCLSHFDVKKVNARMLEIIGLSSGNDLRI